LLLTAILAEVHYHFTILDGSSVGRPCDAGRQF
jgi:hypothetical protein